MIQYNTSEMRIMNRVVLRPYFEIMKSSLSLILISIISWGIDLCKTWSMRLLSSLGRSISPKLINWSNLDSLAKSQIFAKNSWKFWKNNLTWRLLFSNKHFKIDSYIKKIYVTLIRWKIQILYFHWLPLENV